jgi:hypothetical protein
MVRARVYNKINTLGASSFNWCGSQKFVCQIEYVVVHISPITQACSNCMPLFKRKPPIILKKADKNANKHECDPEMYMYKTTER